MTDREAMTLALDALLIWEEMHPRTTASAVRSPAIQALQKALEQPEPTSGNVLMDAYNAMVDKKRQALEQPDPFSRLVRIMGTFDLPTGHADNWNDLLDSLESELRDVLGYYRETFKVEQECNPHPDAPHGFNRDASHGLGRYVCDCEGWEPEPWDTTDMGIDRGAWDDVPDATKWVDELRGGDETEQEPVAWMYVNRDGECEQIEFGTAFDDPSVTLLYTAPPKREWIGLTDEEIDYLDMETSGTVHDFVHAIEAKLREKNHAI